MRIPSYLPDGVPGALPLETPRDDRQQEDHRRAVLCGGVQWSGPVAQGGRL